MLGEKNVLLLFTVWTVKPGHLEEDCSVTTFSESKRFSIFCQQTNSIHKFNGCFLRGQVSTNGFKVFVPLP